MSNMIIGQTTVAESRKESLKSILNYRYKGGFYTLEKHFNNSVKYPETARMNCRLGITIASVNIDCNGVVQQVKLKNSLKLGIDEAISNFFNSTAGNWNTCDDDRYTKFDIPIQFTIEGTETNSTDALFICTADPLDGQECYADEYLMKKFTKYFEKENGKKAMQYIDALIKRDPYNNEYHNMKKEAMAFL